ncbi:pentatricopeptide repeat-containing protein [Tanacetum coccineum]
MGNNDESGNTIVSWYTRMGDMVKAIDTFGNMRVRNPASWVAMVGGYVDIGNMEIARNYVMLEQNVLSCVKMIDVYSKKGVVESAREVFNEINEKDHLVYNSMITCYAQNGWLKETLQQMRITMDDHLATAFIDLYVKCGRVDKAYGLFYGLQKKLMICIQQDVTDEDITRVGPFKIRKTILENDHRKYLEECFRDREDNTILA